MPTIDNVRISNTPINETVIADDETPSIHVRSESPIPSSLPTPTILVFTPPHTPIDDVIICPMENNDSAIDVRSPSRPTSPPIVMSVVECHNLFE